MTKEQKRGLMILHWLFPEGVSTSFKYAVWQYMEFKGLEMNAINVRKVGQLIKQWEASEE